MQKLVSILFSGLILFQSLNISIEDISKLSILMEHAAYHQEAYGDSFIEFIAGHYTTMEDHVNAEHEEHDELPFKQSHQSSSHLSVVFLLNDTIFVFQGQGFANTQLNFFYKESQSLFEKASVFQPPRFS